MRVQREKETTSIEIEADREEAEEAEEVEDICTEEDALDHRGHTEVVITITTLAHTAAASRLDSLAAGTR